MKRAAAIAGLVLLAVLLAFFLLPGTQWIPSQSSGAYLEVERGGMDAGEDTIDYDELSSDQRDRFEQALNGDRIEIPDDPDSSVWYEYAAVRYENDTYAILVTED